MLTGRTRRGWTHWDYRYDDNGDWWRCDQVEGRFAVEGSKNRQYWRVITKEGRVVSTGHFSRLRAIRVAEKMEADLKEKE